MIQTEHPSGNPQGGRMPSVDLLRGFTMLLMVFVNDLWTVKGVPQWMLHVAPDADGMGLSDIVFPAFLFIVGLSLPLALEARTAPGDPPMSMVRHVVTRAFALIVMGLFLVNGEYLNRDATGMSQHAWYLASCLGFLLIWNTYPALTERKWAKLFRSAGILILVGLAWGYRGGKEALPYVFKPHWWGILGLIGWAYLAGGILTIAARGRVGMIVAGWAGFTALSLLHHARMIPEMMYVLPEPVIGGTMTALVMGGVLTMTLFRRMCVPSLYKKRMILFGSAVIGLVIGYGVTRPVWGLSKQHATPAWLFICSALTLTAFALMQWATKRGGARWWLHSVRSAGANTLLTYLMPFIGYAGAAASHLRLPDWMLNGPVGLLKSALFAILCAEAAGLLARRWVKLRL